MYRTSKYKHITVIYEKLWTVAEMVAKYYDTPEYENTLFVLNFGFTVDAIRTFKQTYSRLIFYNLEHFSAESYNKEANEWRHIFMHTLAGYDEIWDFLIENYKYYPKNIKPKYKFMPPRYLDLSCEKHEKIYDLIFLGFADTPVRKDLMLKIGYVFKQYWPKTMVVTGLWGKECREFSQYFKYSLDYPHYRLFGNTQNAIRIHESLCANVQVISYTDTTRVINYFPGIIEIINPVNGFDQEKTYELICNYKDRDVAKAYSDMTETDEAYQKYREQFLCLL